MTMGLRDELPKSTNEIQRLEDWIAAQPNADEWREVIHDTATYTATAITGLLSKYGFQTNNQTIYRFRTKHGSR
jgi:hypothetical protein